MLRTQTPGLPSQYTEAFREDFHSDQGEWCACYKSPNSDYRLGPAPFALAVGLLVVLSAHSHSESQFLPHRP